MPFTKDDPNINREGRKKGSVSVVSALKRKLEQQTDELDSNGEKRKVLDDLVDVIIEKAKTHKDTAMIKDIIDRVDGKPHQTTDITTDGEKIETGVVVLPSKEEA